MGQHAPSRDGISELIDVNTEYCVFLCPKCCTAIQPSTFTDHLRVKHRTSLPEREQVQAYIGYIGWDYTSKTVELPKPMSRKQPLLKVTDAFECQLCVAQGCPRPFITQSQKTLRNHGIDEHRMPRAGMSTLGQSVRVQSWFRKGGTERFWPVDDTLEGGLGEGVGTRQTVTTQANDDDVGEATREGGIEVINIDSDPDATIVVDHSVIVVSSDESDNEVLVPRRERAVSPVEDLVNGDNGDTGYEPGSDGWSDGEESAAVAGDDEEDGAVKASPWRIRRQPALLDRVGAGIDSEDDQEPPRLAKRQKKVAFVDSGAVMGSSDSEAVPGSSPPVVWTVESSSDGAEQVADAGLFVAPAPEDASIRRRRLLRDRLDEWCQACPVCVLAQDCENIVHQVKDCLQKGTELLVAEAEKMQQHIKDSGGFEGEDACQWCGVPRVMCNQWRQGRGGSWGIVDGQACQFLGRLVVAVYRMMMDGSGEGFAVVQEWLVRGGVRPKSPVEVFEWFRGAEEWDIIGMEVPRILRVFDMLVNKNRGVGKI